MVEQQMKILFAAALFLISTSACVKTTQDETTGSGSIQSSSLIPTSPSSPTNSTPSVTTTPTPVGSLSPGQDAGSAAAVGCTLNASIGTFTGINTYQPQPNPIATCPSTAIVSVSPMGAAAPTMPLQWRNKQGNKVLSLYQWFTAPGVYSYSFTVTNNSQQWTRIIQFEIGERLPLNASAKFHSVLGQACLTATVPRCIYPTNLTSYATLAWVNGSAKCRIERPRTTIMLSVPGAPIGVTAWNFYYAKNPDPYSAACVSGDVQSSTPLISGAPSCRLPMSPIIFATGKNPTAVNSGNSHYWQYNADTLTNRPGNVTLTCPVGSNPVNPFGRNRCEIWKLPANSTQTLEVSGKTVYLSAAASAPYCPTGMLREGVNTGRCIVGNFTSWTPYVDNSSAEKRVLVSPSLTECLAEI
jgi:hypothetical protein